MENERRNDPPEQSDARPQEGSNQDEPRGRDDRPEREDRPEQEDRGEFSGEPHSEGPSESRSEGPSGEGYEMPPAGGPQEGAPPQEGQHQDHGPGMGPGRGRRRGGRGRMSQRDRRMQGRGGRRREHRPPYQAPHGAHGPSPQGHMDERERRPSHSDLPPEQRSWILQAKAEVERIRETLEGVLRDLEEVSAQLTKAEHEKDIAEAEIEQLKDSLRRLHR